MLLNYVKSSFRTNKRFIVFINLLINWLAVKVNILTLKFITRDRKIVTFAYFYYET